MRDYHKEQWEENAEAYASLIADEGTPHQKLILKPAVERLLGDVSGKRLLDAGCGEGYLSRYYARKGAIVTGVDISPSLLKFAREESQDIGLDVTYIEEDICHLSSIDDDSFDIVLSNLVLLNVPCYIDAIKSFNRVLKMGGILVFSIVHPAFNFYGPGKWEMGEKDPETRRREGLYFKLDHYPEEKEYRRYWYTREGEKFPEEISFYHRTLSTYVNILVTNGFQIELIDEPLPPPNNEFFDREERVPFFLVIEARKIK